MSIIECIIYLASVAAPSKEDATSIRDLMIAFSPLGATLVGLIALIISAIMTTKTLRVSTLNNEASLWQKANEVESKEIQEKLDRFYGPFSQMSGTNALLARDLRQRQADSTKFLLIEKLFDREWLSSLPDAEKTLVDEIVQNAVNLRKFIIENAKMVDSKVQPYLSRVSAHYRILELAHSGKLGGDPKSFVEKYVFPIQVDSVLALEVERLEKRKKLLRSQPNVRPPQLPELLIPESLKLKELPYPKRENREGLNVPILDQPNLNEKDTPGKT
jgi:hypothetical protein